MLGRIGALRVRLRRLISRTEWLVRLLGLPRERGPQPPGLILVQIDGLGRAELETALRKGHMPFLRRLLREGDWRLHTLYPGVPTSTPSVQGELFYGVRGCVPAFSFRDRATGEIVRMFDPAPAARMEARLSAGADPLLKGGSAWSNIFSGGAAEANFCAATAGFGELFRRANPVVLAGLLLWHGASVLRVLALIAVELVLALVDAARGIHAGKDLPHELAFVFTRVGISILLREVVSIGAAADAARGLPVIHLNLLGYDEQSHRRGPDSAFAHWSLKGIDRAVRRVAGAARMSRREYDIWIYSDHGQQRSRPYPHLYGDTVENRIAALFGEPASRGPAADGVQYTRARWLGGWPQRLFRFPGQGPEQPLVAAMGPVGHVYAPAPVADPDAMARRMVTEAHVPMVLMAGAPGRAQAVTEWGDFELPRDARQVFGPNHPFAGEAAADLAELCHHPDAGDFVLCGWQRDGAYVTFPVQHGAHGGPGPDECRAFAILPSHAVLPKGAPFLRVADLRAAALTALGRHAAPRPLRRGARPPEGGAVRVMTYNVHGCVGTDGRLSPHRIARVIARYRPDVVCLQELDVGRARSGRMDQAHEIATALGMGVDFHPAMVIEDEHYGNAVLSRLPMHRVHAGPLPGDPRHPAREPRGALWVTVDTPFGPLQVITTHLGLAPAERRRQAAALTGPQWAGHPDFSGPGLLCGDFNSFPGSPAHRHLCAALRDAQAALAGHRPRATWSGQYQLGRIDHLFLNGCLTVTAVEVPRTALTRAASDHLPVVADVRPAGKPA